MNDDNQTKKPVHKSKKHIGRKKWIIVIGVVIVLFAAGIICGWFYVSYQKAATADKLVAQQAKRNAIINQTATSVQNIVDKGGKPSEAGLVYANSIKATTDSTLKHDLLMDEATMYFNANYFDQALTVALQAESITKDANVEQFIAQIYEGNGNKVAAVKYYQSAISLVDKSQPMGASDIEYYQSKVDGLSGATQK